ncbi:MAG: glutathione S-transferase family protein [Proteobacteria bacterium]|nr:glutathione S-transferase family protein [Pseudomonadota bacterium]
MQLHTSAIAPSPRRVHIFAAEKGIDLPRVEVDINSMENRKQPFMELNPMGKVPVLELDDGSFLSESMAICRYLEDLHPEPNLLGRDAREAAFVEMWNRRMEHEIVLSVFATFQNTHDYFKERIEQVPEYGEVSKRNVLGRLAWMDGELAQRPYVAGDRFTVADITLLAAVDFGRVTGIRIQDDQQNLARWHESVSSRPSAGA